MRVTKCLSQVPSSTSVSVAADQLIARRSMRARDSEGQIHSSMLSTKGRTQPEAAWERDERSRLMAERYLSAQRPITFLRPVADSVNCLPAIDPGTSTTAAPVDPTTRAAIDPSPRAINPAAAVDPSAAGTPPAIDPYTGVGLRRRRKPGAPGDCGHDRRARPLPKAPQKRTPIDRFVALRGDCLFIG